MKFHSLIYALAAASTFIVTVPAAAENSCDPTDIIDVIELAHMERVEVTAGSDLFWLSIDPTADTGSLAEDLVDQNGAVRASAIQIITEGGDCSVIVDEMRVKRGGSWRDLRLAGNNVFAPGYMSERFSVNTLNVGLKLFLLQRAYCDITVRALVYANIHPFLRPYPYPDPDC